MEDFEYSVEISDRDWQCFFTECEECNLLPPSLAGLDDSGMSDLDDTASMLARKVQKRDLTVGFLEPNQPCDGPQDCEGPPAEHCLSKRGGGGGLESVLSGSEEDIHLQSVNMFFERLRNLTEAERPAEPSPVRAGKNTEAKEEELQWSHGNHARSSSLPKNAPKLNSPPARGETAFGKETMDPVDTESSTNTMKPVKPGFGISLEPAASNSAMEPNRLAHSETEVFVREEASTETRVRPQSRDSLTTPHTAACTDGVIKAHMCKPLEGLKNLSTSQVAPSKKCSTDLLNNLEMPVGPGVLQPDPTSTNKTAAQESSPSASVKRKRRKKRRLSIEPAESGPGCERQALGRQGTDDSEEDQRTWRGGPGLCLSEEIGSANPLNDGFHSDPACESHNRYLADSTVRQGRREAAGLADIHSADKSPTVTRLSHTVSKAPDAGSNVPETPCMKLQAEELSGLNKYCWLPCSAAASVVGKSETPGGTGIRETNDAHAESRQQSSKANHVNTDGEKEQNLSSSTAKVKSVTHSVLPRAESNDPRVEVSQNDNLSVAKSVLAVQGGGSGRYNHSVCQRGPEQQQQLESDTDRISSTPGRTRFPLCQTGRMGPDAHGTPTPSASASLLSDDASCKVSDAKVAACCNNPPSLNQTACPLEGQTLSNSNVLLETLKAAVCKLEPPQIKLLGPCDEPNPRESGDSLTSPFDLTPLSSCCSLDTESFPTLSSENVADVSAGFHSPVAQSESGGRVERKSPMLERDVEEDAPVGPDSAESACDEVTGLQDAVAPLGANHAPVKAPNPKPAVFTMSSFWSEMEKLTINDILGVRMADGAAPQGSLTPLQVHEENAMFAASVSGVFTELNESKLEETAGYALSAPVSAPSSFGSAATLGSSSSRSVLWESETAPVSPDADIYTSPPVFSGAAQTCLRKISKNVSVHNLHALESEPFGSALKAQTLPTLDEGGPEKVLYLPDDTGPSKASESSPSSLADSYRTSIVDVFRYFFGGKEPAPTQPASDSLPALSIDGKSVPETYDLFFSDYDTESFFCPLIPEERAKDELVPIFSCSRSANRSLQFPEAYDYFFPSSSSDDSSVESEDDDSSGPVRVVSRFTQKANSSPISGDLYENFFTDRDLGQNFIWKDTLSFRNFTLTGSASQKQANSLSLVPVRRNDASLRRTVYPSNVLGNTDVAFPDPLLHHLQDRISKQLTQQPFTYEDLQTAVSNPRLEAPFLPLKQSDMCLVCIAFASWVLKTANPQAGDAWKAVVLANVSALSAIRYLRKYVRVEAAAGEKKLNPDVTSDS